MTFERYYWREDPDAPFAKFLAMIEYYCHPEASDNYDDLINFVRNPALAEKTRPFKEGLAAAIIDPSQIPNGALFDAAQYDDGSAEKFLHRVWHDLYPDEPLPAR